MSKIVFLAPFPKGEEIKDGMMQRVVAVDEYFKDYSRIYLQISLRHNFKIIKSIERNRIVLKVNLFKHLKLINKIIRAAELCYIHSIYNLVAPYILQIKAKKMVLDIHGVVPEEHFLAKKRFMGFLYNIIEKYAFSNIHAAIIVSNEMKKHYQNKYKKTVNYILKPIYPQNLYLFNTNDTNNLSKRKELGIPMDSNVIIYSGNTQAWQNIELMTNIIKRNLENKNIFFIILTQKVEEFKQIFKDFSNRNLIIKSVEPKFLSDYYEIANYGFILRDEHVVNKVAAPTKLIEYLTFGIIPIVKSPLIGDAFDLGYEYVIYTEDFATLPPQKSIRNMKIAKRILKNSMEKEYQELINYQIKN